MRTRRRNWILKRIVLGFAVAALVAPAAAQARVDEGISGQPNAASEISGVKSGDYVPFVTDFPSYANQSVKADSGVQLADPKYGQTQDVGGVQLADPKFGQADTRQVGMPRAMPSDYAKAGVSLREVQVPQAVSGSGFDWSDAGIGAGLALGLVLIGAAAVRASRHLGKTQTA